MCTLFVSFLFVFHTCVRFNVQRYDPNPGKKNEISLFYEKFIGPYIRYIVKSK